MWDTVKQTDFARARQELELRRAETLRRHAVEIESLEADAAAIETLNRLAAAFCEKFRKAASPPAAAVVIGDESSSDSRQLDQRDRRDYARTNFDVFSRAMARATF